MNAELIDIAVLRVLEENDTRFGLGVPALSLLVGRYAVTLDADGMRRRLEYLCDPSVGFVTPVNRGEFHPENMSFKITAKGTNHLRLCG